MPKRSRGEFLTLMAAAMAIVPIAIDAVLPAFGHVRAHFGLAPTSADVALVITVFMAGLGIGQFVYGPLADRFGRKPVFLAGILLYVVAGLLTSVAPSLDVLLVGRFFWGLGAAGPRVVTQAMLRDRFRGDELASAMAVIMTMFLAVPTVAPLLGRAVFELGSWRWTFAVGPAFGTLVALWSLRADESLEHTQRLPLDVQTIGRSTLEVFRTPSAVWNMIAWMMLSAAFLPYLASSERIYGAAYDRADQFFLWFSAASVVMASVTLATSRIVARLGTKTTTMGALALLVGLGVANLTVTLLTAGTPPFVFFVVTTTLLISLTAALSPLLISRTLEDVGHIAGTAASTTGAIAFIGASLLSPFVDRAIETTVTPFAAGYVVFTLLAGLAAIAADRRGTLAPRSRISS